MGLRCMAYERTGAGDLISRLQFGCLSEWRVPWVVVAKDHRVVRTSFSFSHWSGSLEWGGMSCCYLPDISFNGFSDLFVISHNPCLVLV